MEKKDKKVKALIEKTDTLNKEISQRLYEQKAYFSAE